MKLCSSEVFQETLLELEWIKKMPEILGFALPNNSLQRRKRSSHVRLVEKKYDNSLKLLDF